MIELPITTVLTASPLAGIIDWKTIYHKMHNMSMICMTRSRRTNAYIAIMPQLSLNKYSWKVASFGTVPVGLSLSLIDLFYFVHTSNVSDEGGQATWTSKFYMNWELSYLWSFFSSFWFPPPLVRVVPASALDAVDVT
jgi:hypothetical protein